MAQRQVRAYRSCTLGETLTHITAALTVVVIVYLIAGVVGEGAVTLARYLTG